METPHLCLKEGLLWEVSYVWPERKKTRQTMPKSKSLTHGQIMTEQYFHVVKSFFGSTQSQKFYVSWCQWMSVEISIHQKFFSNSRRLDSSPDRTFEKMGSSYQIYQTKADSRHDDWWFRILRSASFYSSRIDKK